MRKDWRIRANYRFAEYNVLAAIRSNDTQPSGPWKTHVVARIRAIVFESHECPGAWNNVPMEQEDFDSLPVPTDNLHFFDHLDAAVRLTQDHPVWGGFAQRVALLARAVGDPT